MICNGFRHDIGDNMYLYNNDNYSNILFFNQKQIQQENVNFSSFILQFVNSKINSH